MHFDVIHEFWFGKLVDGQADEAHQKLWYRGSEEDDAIIKGRFTNYLSAASKGDLDHWKASAKGRLALIIICDQFSRNIFRGTANAFLYDDMALQVATEGVDLGIDQYLEVVERQFFYMPFQHSESLEVQARSLQLYQRLVNESSSDAEKKMATSSLDYALKHEKIIRRFGRYPHRNKALFRESTAEELAYLASGASTFGQ